MGKIHKLCQATVTHSCWAFDPRGEQPDRSWKRERWKERDNKIIQVEPTGFPRAPGIPLGPSGAAVPGSPGTRPAVRTTSAAPGGKPAASLCTISAAWTRSSSTRSGCRWTAGPPLRTWTPRPCLLSPSEPGQGVGCRRLPQLQRCEPDRSGPTAWAPDAGFCGPPGVKPSPKLVFHGACWPGSGGMPRDWAPANQRLRRAHRSPVSTPPSRWRRRASCAKLRQASPWRSRVAGSPGRRGLPLALPECAGQRGEWSNSLQADESAAFQRTGLARPAHTTHARAHTHQPQSPNPLWEAPYFTLQGLCLASVHMINISGQPQIQEEKKKSSEAALWTPLGGTALSVSLVVLHQEVKITVSEQQRVRDCRTCLRS